MDCSFDDFFTTGNRLPASAPDFVGKKKMIQTARRPVWQWFGLRLDQVTGETHMLRKPAAQLEARDGFARAQVEDAGRAAAKQLYDKVTQGTGVDRVAVFEVGKRDALSCTKL
jgi:hypothetical protein